MNIEMSIEMHGRGEIWYIPIWIPDSSLSLFMQKELDQALPVFLFFFFLSKHLLLDFHFSSSYPLHGRKLEYWLKSCMTCKRVLCIALCWHLLQIMYKADLVRYKPFPSALDRGDVYYLLYTTTH